jgi:hypothetical protein
MPASETLLNLDELRLEAVDILRVLEELQEVEGVGIRTLSLDAGDGQVKRS